MGRRTSRDQIIHTLRHTNSESEYESDYDLSSASPSARYGLAHHDDDGDFSFIPIFCFFHRRRSDEISDVSDVSRPSSPVSSTPRTRPRLDESQSSYLSQSHSSGAPFLTIPNVSRRNPRALKRQTNSIDVCIVLPLLLLVITAQLPTCATGRQPAG